MNQTRMKQTIRNVLKAQTDAKPCVADEMGSILRAGYRIYCNGYVNSTHHLWVRHFIVWRNYTKEAELIALEGYQSTLRIAGIGCHIVTLLDGITELVIDDVPKELYDRKGLQA